MDGMVEPQPRELLKIAFNMSQVKQVRLHVFEADNPKDVSARFTSFLNKNSMLHIEAKNYRMFEASMANYIQCELEKIGCSYPGSGLQMRDEHMQFKQVYTSSEVRFVMIEKLNQPVMHAGDYQLHADDLPQDAAVMQERIFDEKAQSISQ